MFREMRRKRQALPQEGMDAVLQKGTSGVLAVSGDHGYPYAVPLSYHISGCQRSCRNGPCASWDGTQHTGVTPERIRAWVAGKL